MVWYDSRYIEGAPPGEGAAPPPTEGAAPPPAEGAPPATEGAPPVEGAPVTAAPVEGAPPPEGAPAPAPAPPAEGILFQNLFFYIHLEIEILLKIINWIIFEWIDHRFYILN